MSREVDERVVEMRFDNEHFEKNVQTSMSTLDKFKQKLQFKNADKGFEDINKAAKNTDLSPLSKSADAVGIKFNAMTTMADQAMRNLTNSAMAYGKKIVSAFTIDPVKTGLQEYETKMNAVQVIKSNTRGKNTMEDITAALEDLNTYADKTIYNFAQMTSNVGKFTAQGYKVEEAANAVKGLANLAAASGASAEDMARATYQMSQALGGTIRLMDWNSLRNANMATVELKNTLIDLAKVNGIAIDDMIAKHGTFEQTLSEGWLTGDMFTEAMNIYSGIYSEAELKAKGFTDAQVKNFMELAKEAESAATEVKTFSQLMDVLKETAQSGWTQTWELIFGNFDEAKTMFTELQKYIGGFIDKTSQARNTLLEAALKFSQPWSKIMDKLNNSSIGKIGKTVDKISDSVENATEKITKFQNIVNDVWRGDYKNADTGRYELLEAAGYDHRVVQDLVNKGYQYKITIEDIQASHEKFGLTMDGATAAMVEEADAAGFATIRLEDLTEEQLRNAKLTDEEIKLFFQLKEAAAEAGVGMHELAAEMSKKDGRTLLIESFKNAGKGLIAVFKAIKDAWAAIFPPKTAFQLYNIIKAINEFSEKLVMGDTTAKNLTRTLKGLFAALDVILTLISLPFKIAFKFVCQLLEYFDLDILSVTATIGDSIVAFRDWIDKILDFSAIFNTIIPPILNAIDAFKAWIGTLKDSDNLPRDIAKGIVSGLGKAFKFIGSILGYLVESIFDGFKGSGDNIISGLVSGIWTGIKIAGQVIIELGKMLLDKFCEFLGIHSPSLKFFAIGGFIVAGLLLGIKNACPELWSQITDMGAQCVDILSKIDYGAIFSAALSAGTTVALYKLSSAFLNFSKAFGGFGDMLEEIGDGARSALKGLGTSLRGEAVKSIATAVAILVGCVVVLGLLPESVVEQGTITLLKIGGMLAVLMLVMSLLPSLISKTTKIDLKDILNISQILLSFVSIGAALLLVAVAMRVMEGIENWKSTILGMISAVVALGLLALAIGKLANPFNDEVMNRAGKFMRKTATAFLIMAIVIRIVGGMDPDAIGIGLGVLTAFAAILSVLAVVINTVNEKKIESVGRVIKSVGICFALLAATAYIISGLSTEELVKAGAGITVFAGIIVGLLAATKLATDKDISKITTVILGIGAAFLMMGLVCSIIGEMNAGDMMQGVVGVGILALIVAGLVAVTNVASDKDIKKATLVIVGMSVAIGILGLVSAILGFISLPHLAKGVGAVTILGSMLALIIYVTKDMQKCLGTLITLGIIVTLLAAAVMVISGIDSTRAIAAAGSLGILMGALASLMVATKFIKTDKGTILKIYEIAGVAGAFTILVVGLSHIKDAETARKNTVILSALITTMTGILVALGAANKLVSKATTGILGLIALSAELYVLGIAISYIPDLTSKIPTITALCAAMTALSIVLTITAAVGAIYSATMGLASLGIIGMLAIIGEVVLLGDALESIPDMSSKISTIQAISDFMIVLSGCLTMISLVGPLALVAVVALAGFETLIMAFGAFAVAVGGFMKLCPWLEELIDIGIPILEKIAYGLGSVVSSYMEGMVGNLPDIGTQLSKFMENMEGFIEGAKSIDKDVLAGIAILTGSFMALGAMELSSDIMSLFGQDSSFDTLAKGLDNIGTVLKDFGEDMSTMDQATLDGVKRGAEALKVVALAAQEIPNTGGWISRIVGNNDIGLFAKMMASSAEDIWDVALWSSDLTDDDVKAVGRAADIVTKLATAAQEIPNSGGLVTAFTGSNNVDDFLNTLNDSMPTLTAVLANMPRMDDDTHNKVLNVVKIFSAIALAAQEIPNMGGYAAVFAGDNGIGLFLKQLNKTMPDFKDLLVDIADNESITKGMVEKAGLVVECIGKIIEAAHEIPNSGGMVSWFTGDNDIGDFIEQINDTMPDFVEFASSLENFNGTSVDKIEYLTGVIVGLINMAGQVKEDCGDELEDLGDELPDFADNLEDFSDEMEDVKTKNLDSAKKKLESIIKVCTQFKANDAKNLKTLSDGLKTLAQSSINEFINTFTSAKSSDDAKKAINTFISSVATAAKSAENYGKFSSIGKYCVDGLVAGLKNNESLAAEAARSVAASMEQAAKEEFDMNSPSKKFETIGEFVDEGMILGVKNKLGEVKKAGAEIGAAVEDGIHEELIMHSPPEKTEEDGEYIDQGMVNGIENKIDDVKNAGTDLGTAVLEGVDVADPVNEAYNKGYATGQAYADGVTAAEAKTKGMGADWYKHKYGEGKVDIFSSDWATEVGFEQYRDAFLAMPLNMRKEFLSKLKRYHPGEYAKIISDSNIKEFFDSIDNEWDAYSNQTWGTQTGRDATRESHKGRYQNLFDDMQRIIDDVDLNYDLWESEHHSDSEDVRLAKEREYVESQIKNYTKLATRYKEALSEYQSATGIVKDEYTDELMSNITSANNSVNDFNDRLAEIDGKKASGSADGVADSYKTHSSPALEYSEKLGRHIVKNIAAGIDAEDSAEEAAKKKVSNISEAFQTAFDDISRDREKVNTEYNNWLLENPDAEQKVKDIQLIKNLQYNLSSAQEAENYAHEKYLQTVDTFGKTSRQAGDAYVDYLKKRNERLKASDELTKANREMLDRIEQEQRDYNKRREEASDNQRKNDYDLWVARHQNASETDKNAKKFEYLQGEAIDAAEDAAELWREYRRILKENNGDEYAEEVIAALNAAQQGDIRATNALNDLTAFKEDETKRAEEAADNLRDSNYNLWVARNQNATDAEKYEAKIAYKQEELNDATEDTLELEKKYLDLLEQNNNELTPEVIDALIAWQDGEANKANIQKEIDDITEDNLERQKKNAEEQRSLAYDIAKLKYDIWEKTYGDDADDATKDAKKLEYLNEQLVIQSTTTQNAMNEYHKAVAEFGWGSKEQLAAYKAYLEEYNQLAELNRQILDIEEESANREKRLRDKQKIAEEEYNEYIKTYKKYYLANGKTMEDLEKDARLVSGYDPSAPVVTALKKTSKALKNASGIMSSRDIVGNFSSMGESYVNALGGGITENTEQATTATAGMVASCITVVQGFGPAWKNTGVSVVKYFAEGMRVGTNSILKPTTVESSKTAGTSVTTGFVKGIVDGLVDLMPTIHDMAQTAVTTLSDDLEINSPSRVFYKLGAYTVEGFARGILDSGLADNATASMANSAVEGFRDSIKQITESVNSDLDTRPTIRPVLDLTDVHEGAARLNTMLNYSQALGISASRKSREVAESNQNGNSDTASSGNTYQFTQNNYSPKALSPAEIYRQTRNQFAAMKGALNK